MPLGLRSAVTFRKTCFASRNKPLPTRALRGNSTRVRVYNKERHPSGASLFCFALTFSLCIRQVWRIFSLGSPQILICGESGGRSCFVDLAGRYRPSQSPCRTRSLARDSPYGCSVYAPRIHARFPSSISPAFDAGFPDERRAVWSFRILQFRPAFRLTPRCSTAPACSLAPYSRHSISTPCRTAIPGRSCT